MFSQDERFEDVDRFYGQLDALEQKLGGKRELRSCNGRLDWPERGVYFFFEPGEYRKITSDVMRVVRVGTHAISEGSSTVLWNRLKQHRGTDNGNGNHRGSVFRLHIGAALIEKSQGAISLPSWGVGSSAQKSVTSQEIEHERKVSEYIGRMPFLWLEVSDASNKQSHRAVIEANSIALLSGVGGKNPTDPPSNQWLGNYSRNQKIRESGLWNVNHVGENYDPHFLDLMAIYLERIGHQQKYEY